MFGGSIAFVTGSSRGVGRAIAFELARRGADVAVNCTSSVSEAEAVCREIRALGRRAVLVVGDTRAPADVRRMTHEIRDALGAVTILVNNAAVALQKQFLEFTVDEWRSQVDYKAVGYFLTARSVIPGMLEHGGGVIVNVLSTVGARGGSGEIGYAVTNGGAMALTRGLAAELGRKQIRVNGVMITWAENAFDAHDPEDARFLPRFALGRVTRLAEVARTVAFLASDDASGITGAIIPVDAGFLLT
jgi:NAD(P)-dependent dehydrogenase (short-subunit alcohol dehydrogenase family)